MRRFKFEDFEVARTLAIVHDVCPEVTLRFAQLWFIVGVLVVKCVLIGAVRASWFCGQVFLCLWQC